MRAVMLLPVGTEAPAVALCPMQVCAAPRTSADHKADGEDPIPIASIKM